MKLYPANKKNLILTVLTVIVTGALLSRQYKTAGNIVALIPIGYYLAVNTRKAIIYLINFKRTDNYQKLSLISYSIIFYVFVNAVVTNRMYYFLLLVMLAIDYILYENKTRK